MRALGGAVGRLFVASLKALFWGALAAEVARLVLSYAWTKGELEPPFGNPDLWQ